jgi:hypothetical protein
MSSCHLGVCVASCFNRFNRCTHEARMSGNCKPVSRFLHTPTETRIQKMTLVLGL